MNRKDFLSTVIPIAAVTTAFNQPAKDLNKPVVIKIPAYLQQGDTIGICCPSGFITASECQAAITRMQQWGYKIKIGNTIGAKDYTLAGTDEERLNDFQRMIDDPEIKAIMLGRGGYGAVRIIDAIDFTTFVQNPKWIIGFSDATVFHLHLNRQYQIPTIHSKMCNSFPDDFMQADAIQIATIESIRQCLDGTLMKYSAIPNINNRPGKAAGEIIGGNLSLIDNLCGSTSDVDTSGKILFIEDVGEYLYRLDGMLWNLKRSGKLKNLKGLIVGMFRIKPDNPGEEFGKSLEQLVMEKVKEYAYPVCFDFPVGHVKENYALKCGMKHVLHVSANEVVLEESRLI